MPRWRCLPPRAFFSRCCGCRDVCTTFRRASMWTRLLTSHAFVVFFDAPLSYIDDITCPVRRGPSRSHFYRRSLGGIVHRIAGSALSLPRRSCATDAINSISQNHRGADIIDQEASVRRWQRRRPDRTVARICAHCDGGGAICVQRVRSRCVGETRGPQAEISPRVAALRAGTVALCCRGQQLRRRVIQPQGSASIRHFSERGQPRKPGIIQSRISGRRGMGE